MQAPTIRKIRIVQTEGTRQIRRLADATEDKPGGRYDTR